MKLWVLFLFTICLPSLFAVESSIIWRTYHTQSAFYKEILDLGNCNGYLTRETLNENPLIEALTIQKTEEELPAEFKNKRQKVFLLFGEHSRELIAQETGLHFIQGLCAKESLLYGADAVLNKNIFKIVYEANPNGKKILESQMNFDKRSNGNDVDTNRNWALNFKKTANALTANLLKQKQTYPGPSAFSEFESRSVALAMKKFQPKVFLSMHSGANGLYIPYAYKQTPVESPQNEDMLSILTTIKYKYCNGTTPSFVVGQLAKILYQVSGNCLDYAYECLGVQYAFAWEIYGGKEESGFTAFNPSGKESYDKEITRWKNAIVDTLEMTYEKPNIPRRAPAEDVCNTGIEDPEVAKLFKN